VGDQKASSHPQCAFSDSIEVEMTDDNVMVILGSMFVVLGLLIFVVVKMPKAYSAGMILFGLSQVGRGLHIGPVAAMNGVALLGLFFFVYAFVRMKFRRKA
jgi:hypothetical protein